MADPLEKLLASISAALEAAHADLANGPGASCPDVLAECFPEQLAFIRDQSPLKWAFCTRRAAKSYSIALDMIDDSFDHPHEHYLIVGLSRLEMKDIYWDNILKDIDSRYNLSAKFNETELTMRMPNGALIRITGADANEKEKRKLLGGKKRKVAIDEAQAWGTDLREIIFGVLKPSVADFRGQIIVVGTPGNLTQGFFHQLTNGCKAHPRPERSPLARVPLPAPRALHVRELLCAYFPHESSRHQANLFLVVVGKTAKARKGTSWNHVRRLTEAVDGTLAIGTGPCPSRKPCREVRWRSGRRPRRGRRCRRIPAASTRRKSRTSR